MKKETLIRLEVTTIKLNRRVETRNSILRLIKSLASNLKLKQMMNLNSLLLIMVKLNHLVPRIKIQKISILNKKKPKSK